MSYQVAMRALPYKQDFLKSLLDDPDLEVTDERVVNSLLEHMHSYQRAIQVVCTPLLTFYKQRNMVILSD